MDRGFDAEHQRFDEHCGQRSRSGQAASSSAEAPSSVAGGDYHRHRAYLAYAAGDIKGDQSFRPKEVHRAAAKRWLDFVDEQVRQLTQHPGLAAAMPDWEALEWRDSEWRRWVYFCFNKDLGPDGVCAINAAEYLWSLNCDRVGDVAHGAHCDWPLVLKKLGMYNFYMCMSVSWNLVFGPDKNHERKHQLSSALKALYAKATPGTTPLFMAKVAGIIACLKRNGHQFDNETPEFEQAWAILAKRPFAVSEGERVTLARVCATVHACNKRTPWWEVEAFERSYLALETGVMKGRAAVKLTIAPGPAEEVAEGGRSTNPALMSLEDRASMRVCANAVAHSAVMLELEGNKRVCDCLGVQGQVFQDFYTDAARSCRSAHGCERWLSRLAVGGLQSHLRAFMDSLANYGKLEQCGFLLSQVDMASAQPGTVEEEDEFANLLGMLSLHATSFRAIRLAWLSSGWPWRLVRCLESDEMAQAWPDVEFRN